MSKPYDIKGWKKGDHKPEDFPGEVEIDLIIQSYINAGVLQKTAWEEPEYLQKKILIAYLGLKESGKRTTDKEIAKYLKDEFGLTSPRLDKNGKSKPFSERWIRDNRKQLQAKGYDVGKG